MRKKLRAILLALAAALVLALGAFIAFIYGRNSAFPPLPNPNGYDDFVQAGTLFSGTIDDYGKLSQQELKELIATNASALALVREGLKKQCAMPIQFHLTNFATISIYLIAQKKTAQVLAAEGRLAEMDGRFEDAARSYMDAMHFGNEISRNGFLINRLVGVACTAIGGIALGELTPQLGCDEMKPIITGLDRLDKTSVTWKEVRQAENVFVRHELRKQPNPLKWVTEWWQGRKMTEGSEAGHQRGIVLVRLLAAELALRCYRAERGAPPTQLAELVPQYLSLVPQDPFSSRSLVYRAQGTNWLLYSIGLDGVDDGGSPAGRGSSGKGDLLFDSSW